MFINIHERDTQYKLIKNKQSPFHALAIQHILLYF